MKNSESRSTAEGSLVVAHTGKSASCAGFIGSVQDVIDGKMDRSLDGRQFDAKVYQYGFLLASPRDNASLGESIIVNATCYTTSTDRSSSQYGRVIYGPKFVTSGLFLIPHSARPSHIVDLLDSHKERDLVQVYNDVYRAIGRPCAFVGLMKFAKFHGAVIGKPPIDGRNIFDNENEYYPLPSTVVQNRHAFIIGVLTDFSQKNDEEVNRQLEKVLYRRVHPGDGLSLQITNHAHALILKSPVAKIEDISPPIVDRVMHVLFDTTTVVSAHLEVFTIEHLENYAANN